MRSLVATFEMVIVPSKVHYKSTPDSCNSKAVMERFKAIKIAGSFSSQVFHTLSLPLTVLFL